MLRNLLSTFLNEKKNDKKENLKAARGSSCAWSGEEQKQDQGQTFGWKSCR